MYFKVRVCFAAYMNILRRNRSTTCIISQIVECDITAVDRISPYGIADSGGFSSKLPIKVEIKTTREMV